MVDELVESIERIDVVEEARRMEYKATDIETALALIPDRCYTAEVQELILECIEVYSAGNLDHHIADVTKDEDVWVIEVAPVYVGDLPEDVGVEFV